MLVSSPFIFSSSHSLAFASLQCEKVQSVVPERFGVPTSFCSGRKRSKWSYRCVLPILSWSDEREVCQVVNLWLTLVFQNYFETSLVCHLQTCLACFIPLHIAAIANVSHWSFVETLQWLGSGLIFSFWKMRHFIICLLSNISWSSTFRCFR